MGTAEGLQIATHELRRTIAQSEDKKGRLAFIRFWEKIGESCFEQKFTRGERKFGVV